MQILDDKKLFSEPLIGLGFSGLVPRVGAPQELRFPIVRKKRVDEYGLSVSVYADASQLPENSGDDFFYQEYVRGSDEYATHAICVDGKVVYSSTYKYLFGADTHVKSFASFPDTTLDLGGYLMPELSDILAEIRYTGCACFNYKLRDGVPMIFELNPRVGGSFTRAAEAYLNAYMQAVRLNNIRLREYGERPLPSVAAAIL
ncbi:MAG: hypothetical protein EKK30_09710 [Hyphomicrobium sp.]|nr:MAG: hypothetical protein EKK30_09710 [Hyphomicrobium sp.]